MAVKPLASTYHPGRFLGQDLRFRHSVQPPGLTSHYEFAPHCPKKKLRRGPGSREPLLSVAGWGCLAHGGRGSMAVGQQPWHLSECAATSQKRRDASDPEAELPDNKPNVKPCSMPALSTYLEDTSTGLLLRDPFARSLQIMNINRALGANSIYGMSVYLKPLHNLRFLRP